MYSWKKLTCGGLGRMAIRSNWDKIAATSCARFTQLSTCGRGRERRAWQKPGTAPWSAGCRPACAAKFAPLYETGRPKQHRSGQTAQVLIERNVHAVKQGGDFREFFLKERAAAPDAGAIHVKRDAARFRPGRHRSQVFPRGQLTAQRTVGQLQQDRARLFAQPFRGLARLRCGCRAIRAPRTGSA